MIIWGRKPYLINSSSPPRWHGVHQDDVCVKEENPHSLIFNSRNHMQVAIHCCNVAARGWLALMEYELFMTTR